MTWFFERRRFGGCGEFSRICRNLLVMALAVMVAASCKPKETGVGDAQSDKGASSVSELVQISTEDLAQKIKTDPTPFTVINVWATWCPPCLKEMPEFARFYQSMDKANVRLFSVVVMSDPEKSVKPFLEKNGIPFPVYYAAIASPDEFVYVLDLDTDWDGALPATFVLDAEGKIVRSWFEEVTAKDLSAAVTLN